MKNRKAIVIKCTQVEITCIFVLAAAGASFSTLIFVGPNETTACELRPFLFTLFFDLMFGSLFIKTLRIYRIIMNRTFRKSRFTVVSSIWLLFTLTCVDLALILAWRYIEEDGMSPATRINSDLMPYGTYTTTVCSSSPRFSFASSFYKVMIVLGGIKMSWQTRTFPANFAEAKFIALAVYQLALLGLIGLLWQSASPNTFLWLQGVCVPLCAFTTVSIVLFPKIPLLDPALATAEMGR